MAAERCLFRVAVGDGEARGVTACKVEGEATLLALLRVATAAAGRGEGVEADPAGVGVLLLLPPPPSSSCLFGAAAAATAAVAAAAAPEVVSFGGARRGARGLTWPVEDTLLLVLRFSMRLFLDKGTWLLSSGLVVAATAAAVAAGLGAAAAAALADFAAVSAAAGVGAVADVVAAGVASAGLVGFSTLAAKPAFGLGGSGGGGGLLTPLADGFLLFGVSSAGFFATFSSLSF